MADTTRSIRKAAILVASLEEEHAAALLRQLSPAQAHALEQTIEQLGEFDPQEQIEVLEEFFRIGPLVPEKNPAGIDLFAPQKLAAGRAVALSDEPPAFAALHDAHPEQLAPYLLREHPQTIAVVVSHLPVERAAEVLAKLPGELQVDVARRLVHLEQADPEILREVERGLESWLSARQMGAGNRTAGVTALAKILSAAVPQARDHILSNLARHDRQLAAQLDASRPSTLVFADLVRMDSVSLAVVLHHADRDVLLLALAGSVEFAERAYRLFPPDEAANLSDSVERILPRTRGEIEAAHAHLAEVARLLEQRGQISPEVRGRLSLAV